MPPRREPRGWLGQEWAKQHTEMTRNHRYLQGLFPQVRFNSGLLTRTLQPPSQGGDTGSTLGLPSSELHGPRVTNGLAADEI
jgi:hypothetical protein